MNQSSRLAAVLAQIAALTSIGRTRVERVASIERDGGNTCEHAARVDAVISRLEGVVADLRKALI